MAHAVVCRRFVQFPSSAKGLAIHMIPSFAPTAGVRRLAEFADAACQAPMDEMPERMRAGLAAVAGDAALVPAAACQPGAHAYTRYVLHADPLGRFTIVSLVWGPRQFTPVHGHHTWCAYAVLEGLLTETAFRYDADTRTAVPSGGVNRAQASISFAYAGLDEIHKLGNGCDNVGRSIHVYGLDAARIGTHVNRVVSVAPESAMPV